MKTLAKGAVIGLLLWGAAVIPAEAAIERTFGSGSLIIPMDGDAYQPSTDGGVYEAYGFIYKLLDRKQTDSNGVLVLVGGEPVPDPIPVYWIIDDLKTAITAADLTISHNTTDPVATEYKATGEIAIPVVGANPAVGKQVKYIGGPFVIDSNYAAAAKTIWANGFQDVNLHVAKVPFTGKVQREMFGTPPKIALMNDSESRTGNATKILESYLKIAGIVNPLTDITGKACDGTPVSGEGCLYDVLTPNEVGGIKDLAGTALGGKSLLFDYSKCPPPFTGCKPTANYRVLWVPHWVGYQDYLQKNGQYASFNALVGTMSATLEDVHDVVMAARDFIDTGNSLFAECAGIETFEWSKFGRFISKFDIGHNGGTNDPTKIYYNQNALDQPYVQVGAITFDPQGGHLHNWRPFQTGDITVTGGPLAMAFSPAPANPKTAYLQADTGYDGDTTVFTYDDAGVPAGTTPPPALHAYKDGDAAKTQWHYYVGGHMDGDITNGYVVYLGGHSYVQCGTTSGGTTTGKSDHEVTLTFDTDMTGMNMDLKIKYKLNGTDYFLTVTSITQGNIQTKTTTSGNLKLDLSTAVVTNKVISGIHLVNLDTANQLEIKEFTTATTWDVAGAKLTDVYDVTETANVEDKPNNNYSTASQIKMKGFLLDQNTASDGTTGGYISGCSPKGASGAGIRYVLNTVFQLDAVTDREFVRSAPVVFKEFLYQGSFEYPSFDGHFRKFQVNADLSLTQKGLKRVDTFGGNDPLSPGDAAPAITNVTDYTDGNGNKKVDANELDKDNPKRSIWACTASGLESGATLDSSNCTMTRFVFEDAASFQPRMGMGTLALTQDVISRRYGMQYNTNTEAWEKKENVLGGIEHSTAAIIGPSTLTNTTRPLMAYFGALDGMLHAVKAGKKTAAELPEASDAGTELWAYIPSSQLPRLQYFRDPNTNSSYPAVDASVAFAEIEYPIGYGTYKTVLLVTMGVGGNSIAALDVTNPEVTPPTLLWERSGVEDDAIVSKIVSMGNGSKVAIGRVRNAAGVREYRAFVTTALKDKKACQDNNGVPLVDGSLCGGIQIYTFDLLTGGQRWRFERVYRSGVNDVPGSLALVDVDQNGDEDYVVAGDMEGNLWLLPTAPDYDRNGSEDVIIRADSTFTDATSTTSSNVIADINPLYAPSRDKDPCTTYPNVPDPCYASGHDQPIGISPTVVVKDGRVYLAWGTGGAQWASASDYYSVYVLEITGLDPYNTVDGSGKLRGATLAYEFTLDQGEKTFGAVTFSQGSLYFGTAFGSVEGLNLKDDIASNNTGNIRGISLTDKASNWKYTAGGKFRGSVYVARGHVYGTTLDGKIVDIGDPSYTEPSALRWFKVRSWREIFNLGTNQ
ncbi:MAG: hypothetical protein A2638_05740 [Nitrospirae bacterium RIFCSPHIGHO2_01_FULL_66_17]|nr:MAG: hypothetical protein A2638_05740 [Nitrospirae bacterium RIFCSPHIGHO2_01_FULL_66_17]